MDLERICASAGLALFGVVGVVSAMPACGASTEGGVAPAQSIDVSIAPAAEASRDLGNFDFGSHDADTWFSVREPDAGPLPIYACGDAASDSPPPWDVDSRDATTGDVCPLPPSHCVLDRWLVSYVNGVCEEGVCRYWRTLHDCTSVGGASCFRDHCEFPRVK